MANAKQASGWRSAVWRRLIRPLEGKAWMVAATIAFCAILGAATYHLWLTFGDQISRQARYRLNPERMRVTPQPEWIRSDVAGSAVTYGQLQQANLLDKELVLQVKQAFGVQPWVKRVVRVNKKYPSTVEVDLEYRRPLAMVEVPANLIPGVDYEGVLPVDDEGVLLPIEISEEQVDAFPKIAGIDTSPAGSPGNPWGDTRVAQAARIVGLLESLWEPLQLWRIEVPPLRAATPESEEDGFVLVTQKRRRFRWGSAPGQERPGEEAAAAKIERLQRFLNEIGPLDSLELSENRHVFESAGLIFAHRTTAETNLH